MARSDWPELLHRGDQVVHGDSRTLVGELPDGSIDLIYLDPPFGTGTTRRGRGQTYRDEPDDPARFVTWLLPWLEHSRRVLRAHGSLVVHLDYRAVHYVKVALDQLFGREHFINELIWCYAVGGKSRRGFGRKHDTLLWYARTGAYQFFPDAVRIERRAGSHMRVRSDDSGARYQEKTDRRTGRVYRYPVASGKVPEDWWIDIETLNHSDRQRNGWPSQKPEKLLERLILATTRTGDLVADWFSGSGTTAAVAQRLQRRFLVAEREEAAVALALQRLSGHSRPVGRIDLGQHPAPGGPRSSRRSTR